MTPPKEGYPIIYPELSEKFDGFRKGELYLFTAGSGIGKSTIVNEIAYDLHMRHGLKLGIMALEEAPARNARRYIGIHLNRPIWLPKVFNETPKEDMKKAFDEVMGSGWWIYDHFGSSNIDTLLSKIRYMITGLGCDVIVLDHISIIVSGLETEGNSDERKTIDLFMTKLRSLIEETGVMVLAVVHLKRPDKGKSYNEGRQVSLSDLRGSGSLEQLSDAVVALERDQQSEGEEANISHIRILKNRPLGITGDAGDCRYNPETGRLCPLSPFEEETKQQTQAQEQDF
jgi:twinkle protein